jgi:sugar phosphate isomerase/epimerase
MKLSICSFSFHRTVKAGEMDFAGYVEFCKEVGCTQLDPWNAHMTDVSPEEAAKHRNPRLAGLEPPKQERVEELRGIVGSAGVPMGLICTDGAHLWEPTEDKRADNRRRAYGWMEIAEQLGATAMRIDAGGPPDLTEEIFEFIVDSYNNDLIPRAEDKGIRVFMENHWGVSNNPDNVQRILDAVPKLNLLFDTNNWAEGRQQEGWRRFAARASEVHVKTFILDDTPKETTVDLEPCFAALQDAGFDGIWSVESCPKEETEISAARKTIELIRQQAN